MNLVVQLRQNNNQAVCLMKDEVHRRQRRYEMTGPASHLMPPLSPVHPRPPTMMVIPTASPDPAQQHAVLLKVWSFRFTFELTPVKVHISPVILTQLLFVLNMFLNVLLLLLTFPLQEAYTSLAAHTSTLTVATGDGARLCLNLELLLFHSPLLRLLVSSLPPLAPPLLLLPQVRQHLFSH